ncbi:MAG: selenoneine biosynthesis selenosugar synthase SenB [Spiribacter sp.]|nr:selenoneine biosynthesis selenosugar synthase SenB [Spiribacter sp.]MDR9488796.1 selenoneine biosynthesis selenosugar synthase SenB [Spiribacter sp.]
MNIALVTPAAPRSRAGNRATATRWSRLLRAAGHRVVILEQWQADDPAFDVMIALHAWRSAASIAAFAQRFPARPLIVVLTGTDIYRFQHTHPAIVRTSLDAAHALIGLHDHVAQAIPATDQAILHTVHQSATPLPPSYPGPATTTFTLCVVGHLREEKDSLRAAAAARLLPADSRIRIIQAGRAHTPDWTTAAQAEMQNNRRYTWRGEISQSATRRLYARSRALVISSIMEGGANVVSEACVAGLPVIASDIPGNTGLLGHDYPGFFPATDTTALARLMARVESDAGFRATLTNWCQTLAPRHTPAAEQAALLRVIHRLSL